MAGGFTSADYDDLVATTLANMKRGSWTDISYTLQNYSAKDILRKSNVKMSTGTQIQFNVSATASAAAQNVRLNEEQTATIVDYMNTPLYVPWRHANTKWALEERTITMNSGPEQLVNLVKVNKLKAYAGLAELMEQNLWTAPASSSDDLQPFGIPYWIVKASGDPSLQGGAPSGHTLVATLDPSTVTQWKNWTGQYATFSTGDAVKKIKKAMYKTSFSPPVNFPDDTTKKENRYKLYTTYEVVSTAESLLESRNDNLGNDLTQSMGKAMIRGVPVVPVAYLDASDSTNPIYGINWDAWEIHFLKGEYMREDGPHRNPNQPRTMIYYVDLSYNFVCMNRRTGGWVLYV